MSQMIIRWLMIYSWTLFMCSLNQETLLLFHSWKLTSEIVEKWRSGWAIFLFIHFAWEWDFSRINFIIRNLMLSTWTLSSRYFMLQISFFSFLPLNVVVALSSFHLFWEGKYFDGEFQFKCITLLLSRRHRENDLNFLSIFLFHNSSASFWSTFRVFFLFIVKKKCSTTLTVKERLKC